MGPVVTVTRIVHYLSYHVLIVYPASLLSTGLRAATSFTIVSIVHNNNILPDSFASQM